MCVVALAVTEHQSGFAAAVASAAAAVEYDEVADFVETVVAQPAAAGEGHEGKIDCLPVEQGSATAGAAGEVGTHTHFAR